MRTQPNRNALRALVRWASYTASCPAAGALFFWR